MPSFLDDTDAIDPATVETGGQLYPVAQWLNGDPKLAAVGGVTHTGGIILPTKYVDDSIAPPPGWTRANVAFTSGKSEQVMATQKPRLAVIRTRFRWFVVRNGVTTFYPRSGYVQDAGMRGHVQALCGLHGFDFPVVVTFKGKASQEFERLLKDYSQKVQDAALKLKKDVRFPRFAFYMRLAPGPHVKVGQKGQESIITPPVSELPNDLTADYLNKIYVGRERLVALQQFYHDAAEWGAAWERPGAEETRDEVDPETGEMTAPSTASAPKTDAERWSEFCAEYDIKQTDVVRGLKFPTPTGYRKAHPEATLETVMQKILDARQPVPEPEWPPADF